jgi:hypothetical protein
MKNVNELYLLNKLTLSLMLKADSIAPPAGTLEHWPWKLYQRKCVPPE